MKSAEKTGSSWSTAIIADFSRRTTEHSVTATAVDMRRLTRQASLAKKSSGPRMARIASLAAAGQQSRVLAPRHRFSDAPRGKRLA
jgi:hypothetical protein